MAKEETAESARDEEAAFGRARRLRLWSILFVVVAVSLWIQWLGPGILAEARSEDGSEFVAALHSLPFFAVAVGVIWRHPAILLGLVPVSFLPGLAMLPDAELEALASPGALIVSLATFALYLVVAAGAPDWRAVRGEVRGDIDGRGRKDGHADIFRRFVILRFSAMGLLFAAISYALFFDPATSEALASLDDESAMRTQHVFTVVAMYFAWMIAVYIGAILPALNWEHHRRGSGMSADLKRLIARPDRLVRRVLLWLGCLFVTTLFLFFFML